MSKTVTPLRDTTRSMLITQQATFYRVQRYNTATQHEREQFALTIWSLPIEELRAAYRWAAEQCKSCQRGEVELWREICQFRAWREVRETIKQVGITRAAA